MLNNLYIFVFLKVLFASILRDCIGLGVEENEMLNCPAYDMLMLVDVEIMFFVII